MSSIVFILGAGASRACGGPLMSDFLDNASDLYLANRIQIDKRVHFEKIFSVIGSLQAVHSKSQLDLTNIETVFTALEMGNIIKSVPGLKPDEIPGAISSLKELIVNTLEEKIEFPVLDSGLGVPRGYDNFSELLELLRERASPKRSISIIAFNYDLAADVALFARNIGPDYVIGKPSHINDPIQLLKLHGSVNWAESIEDKKIIPLQLYDHLRFMHSFERTRGESTRLFVGNNIVNHIFNAYRIKVKNEPVIVPPSWNKSDYHFALSDIWAAAATHLSEAEYIFVIGYSLPETDSFFRHLYALGSVSKDKTIRKFVVFNPDESVDERFRTLLGPGASSRYKFIQADFENSLSIILNYFIK